MTGGEAKRKLATARQRRERLADWVGAVEAARAAALLDQPKPEDTQPAAWRARAGLAACEQGYAGVEIRLPTDHGDVAEGLCGGRPGLEAARAEMRRLNDQVEALESELPSKAEVAKAEAEAAELIAQVEREGRGYAEAWTALLEALAAVEPLAVELVERRRAVAGNELAHLIEEYGLDAEVATAPALDRQEIQLAQLFIELARQALGAEALSPQTLRAIASAKRQLAASVEAAA